MALDYFNDWSVISQWYFFSIKYKSQIKNVVVYSTFSNSTLNLSNFKLLGPSKVADSIVSSKDALNRKMRWP